MSRTSDAADPHRDPAWRWHRAAAGLALKADRATATARGYRRDWEACRTDADRAALAARRPAVAAAHGVYRDPAGRLRTALEARVLAGEPAADVARKAGLSLAAVGAYEALFFDVRDRCAAVDFVVQRVIGPPDRWEAAVRLLAYLGGPAVADEVLTGPAGARPQGAEGVADFLTDRAAAALRAGAAGAAAGAQDPAARAALVRFAASGLAKRSDDGGRLTPIEKHVKAMLDEIPWASGADATTILRPAVARADAGAAELRDDELQRLAAGEQVPGWEAEAGLVLPERRRVREPGSILTPPTPAAPTAPAQPPAAKGPPRKPSAGSGSGPGGHA
jgi:hypothetical protein